MNSTTLEGVEPVSVWQYFSRLSAVPRPSKREHRAQQFVLDVAKQNNLATDVDTAGNVVIKVPATPGHENVPITVLQGHLDMVCEKNSGTEHDFDKDGIRLVRDKDAKGEAIIRADGTTLGADNGIGVAMALAVATCTDVVHGPLELLFTLDEEAGMTGAKGLTPDAFKGRRLLNLDSEEDDAIYIGCAGGTDTNVSWCLETDAPIADNACFEVRVSGLRGGHVRVRHPRRPWQRHQAAGARGGAVRR